VKLRVRAPTCLRRASTLGVFLPVAAIHVYRTRGRRELVRATAVFTGVLLAFLVPFVVLAPGGVGYSFYTQVVRKLQIESLGASLLLGFDGASIYVSTIIPGKPGSIDLDGMLPDGVRILTSALFLLVLLSVLRDGGGATAAVPRDTEV
jgi:hypothetical protein